ncbi:MAG: hypothetical protein LAT55_04610 [Opitutales bacterium]|nr:hypothetical protein [Opitutales bacterium]
MPLFASYQERQNYGQNLEPENRILHGAGQDAQGFDAYCRLVGAPLHPALYMTYTGLRNPESTAQWADRLRQNLLEEARPYLLPQIGLGMTRDGSPEEHYEHRVAEGYHDEALEILAKTLKGIGSPAFLRIGYEFNGHWNGYQPESFIAAWKYVVAFLKARKVDFASVWCWAKEGDPDFMKFYPGDEFVDWWGIDLFSTSHLDPKDPFYDEAHKHRKPVMIGESTARFVGTLEGQKSWDQWFRPYFEVLQRQPGIKAFCYINWKWDRFPQWHDWGDCRLQMNPVVAEQYRREISNPIYQHVS